MQLKINYDVLAVIQKGYKLSLQPSDLSTFASSITRGSITSFIMAHFYIFFMAFYTLVYNEIFLVHPADECKTHKDCKDKSRVYRYCCGGGYGFLTGGDRKHRECRLFDCENNYCETDTDCGNSQLCCHLTQKECIRGGCSGCTSNSDCGSGYVCCKDVCAPDCLGKPCNNNNDCGGSLDCCHGGNCVHYTSLTGGCILNCRRNSDCDRGEYCCKGLADDDSLSERCRSNSCEGEKCESDDDCGPLHEQCENKTCTSIAEPTSTFTPKPSSTPSSTQVSTPPDPVLSENPSTSGPINKANGVGLSSQIIVIVVLLTAVGVSRAVL